VLSWNETMHQAGSAIAARACYRWSIVRRSRPPVKSSNVESQEVGCLGSCMLDTGCMCETDPSAVHSVQIGRYLGIHFESTSFNDLLSSLTEV
jgi:hypothetical protein